MEIKLNNQELNKLMFLPIAPQQGDSDDGEVCHVCLQKKPLTKEHVPPKGAFNNHTKLWDHLALTNTNHSGRSMIRGGFWVKTLCKDCNTGICSPYAKRYVEFIYDLVSAPSIFDSSGEAKLIRISSDTLYLAKEIATMILAIEPLSFAKHHNKLRQFVLNKELTIKPDFKLLAFLVLNREEAGTITRYHGRVPTYAPKYGFAGGEISSYPFGFIYTNEIGQGYYPEKFTDITRWFSDYDSPERFDLITKFYSRITGVESIQCGLGKPRKRPQFDY